MKRIQFSKYEANVLCLSFELGLMLIDIGYELCVQRIWDGHVISDVSLCCWEWRNM